MIEDTLQGKSTDDIAQILSDLEREIDEKENGTDLVEGEISKLGRDILGLRSRIKELEDTLRMGRKLLRERKTDYKVATRRFWAVKRGL